METFYLVDFENVHNEGVENIDSLTKQDHVHIFSTPNSLNIRLDIVFAKGIDIQGHVVPVRKQSCDMHLVSYLGYLLGIHGKQCEYIIISNDTDYDNIINFWQEEGYKNISRKRKISETSTSKKLTTDSQVTKVSNSVNGTISKGMAHKFSGEEKSKLNVYMQHELRAMGYSVNDANTVCKYVVAHCNDERMLNGIYNDLRNEYGDCSEIYDAVRRVLSKYVTNSSIEKREAQIRSFFGQHFKKKVYVDRKEQIISLILHAENKQQINNGLLKLYSDGNVVKHIYQTLQPLIKDLPGK